MLDADIDYYETVPCPGCQRMLVTPMAVTACSAKEHDYPDFIWFDGMRSRRRRTDWFEPLMNKVWAAGATEANVAFRGESSWRWCRTPLPPRKQVPWKEGTLSARVRLGDLPKPAFGTEEWNWLRRWVVLDC